MRIKCKLSINFSLRKKNIETTYIYTHTLYELQHRISSEKNMSFFMCISLTFTLGCGKFNQIHSHSTLTPPPRNGFLEILHPQSLWQGAFFLSHACTHITRLLLRILVHINIGVFRSYNVEASFSHWENWHILPDWESWCLWTHPSK
jgi:hypothetical protein